MSYHEVSSLEEVRANIDRIDKQIVTLLAERQYFVKMQHGLKNRPTM